MTFIYRYLYELVWLSWAGYWWLASRNGKANAYKESTSSRLLHIIPLGIAFLLIALPEGSIAWIDIQILPPRYWRLWFWVGVFLTLSGLALTVWARRYLGRNWSGIITVKKDHQLITQGPYRIVRNPMYSGILVAFIGTAIARGNMQGLLAVIIVLLTLLRKIRIEGKLLHNQFGSEFLIYTQRTKALIPFIL